MWSPLSENLSFSVGLNIDTLRHTTLSIQIFSSCALKQIFFEWRIVRRETAIPMLWSVCVCGGLWGVLGVTL